VVIMENLSPHKSTQTVELIQQVGAQVLFLPPYSPDLNPVGKNVEQTYGVFFAVKRLDPCEHSSRP
jgi:transposase